MFNQWLHFLEFRNCVAILATKASGTVECLQIQPILAKVQLFKLKFNISIFTDIFFTFLSLFPPFSGFVFAWTRTSQKGHLHFYTKSISCNLFYTKSSICNFFHTKSRPWKRRRFFLSRRASTLTPIFPTSSGYIYSHLYIS